MSETLLFNNTNLRSEDEMFQPQTDDKVVENDVLATKNIEVDTSESLSSKNTEDIGSPDSTSEIIDPYKISPASSTKQAKIKHSKDKKTHDDVYAGFKIFKWRNFLGIGEDITYDFAILDPGYGNVKIAKVSFKEQRIDCFIAPSVVSEVPEWQAETFEGVGQSSSVEYKGKKKKISENLKEIGFNSVTFAAQGLGIWFQANAPEHAVVNDIGFNTVDVLIINHRKVLRELCFSIKELGLISFLEKLTKGDPYVLAMKLEQGDPDLTQKVKNYYFQWLEEQMSVRSEWRRVLDSNVLVGNFIIGGGGARFFPKKYRSYVTIPKDPEFANVEGLAKYFISLKLNS